MPKGEDWEQEDYRHIKQAEAFLFLISRSHEKQLFGYVPLSVEG